MEMWRRILEKCEIVRHDIVHLLWPHLLSMLKDCSGKSQQNSDSWHYLPLSGEQRDECLLAYPNVREEKTFWEPPNELVWPLTASCDAGLPAPWLFGLLQLCCLHSGVSSGLGATCHGDSGPSWMGAHTPTGSAGRPRLGRHLDLWLRGHYTIGIRHRKTDSENIPSRLEWNSGRKCRSDKIRQQQRGWRRVSQRLKEQRLQRQKLQARQLPISK